MALRARQMLGKYRIEKRLSAGGFATVYQAMDTIEGVRVALKVPLAVHVTEEVLKDFRHEVRVAAKLEHPNILPLKDASFIEERFVLTFPLGVKTLADRLQKRMSVKVALDYGEQILKALAYAHQHHVIHCDVKPENIVLFDHDKLRLADFGIAKVAAKTVQGKGTGTVGYMAPEQAMGKPSQRSDVFSAGLILWRMLSGEWPEWPFTWPPKGYKKVRSKVSPEFVRFLQRSIDPNPRQRYRDADQMLNAFLRLKPRVLKHVERRRQRLA